MTMLRTENYRAIVRAVVSAEVAPRLLLSALLLACATTSTPAREEARATPLARSAPLSAPRGHIPEGEPCERSEQCETGECAPERCQRMCRRPPKMCGGRMGPRPKPYLACSCDGTLASVWIWCDEEETDYHHLIAEYGECTVSTCPELRGTPCDLSAPEQFDTRLTGNNLDAYEGLQIVRTSSGRVAKPSVAVRAGRVSSPLEPLKDQGFFVDLSGNGECDAGEPMLYFTRSVDRTSGSVEVVLLGQPQARDCRGDPSRR
jgi:hypothetical protein